MNRDETETYLSTNHEMIATKFKEFLKSGKQIQTFYLLFKIQVRNRNIFYF